MQLIYFLVFLAITYAKKQDILYEFFLIIFYIKHNCLVFFDLFIFDIIFMLYRVATHSG